MTDLRKIASELAEKMVMQCDPHVTYKNSGAVHFIIESAILAGMKAALAEPSREMLEAGDAALSDPSDLPQVWNAMARVRAEELK